jgi:hypothetical protein
MSKYWNSYGKRIARKLQEEQNLELSSKMPEGAKQAYSNALKKKAANDNPKFRLALLKKKQYNLEQQARYNERQAVREEYKNRIHSLRKSPIEL